MTTVAPVKKRKGLLGRTPKPYVHPYLGGVLLGLVLFTAFLLTRNGLGASGGLNRLTAAAQDIVAPSHIDNTPYLLKMAGGTLNPLDDWSVLVFVGALLGGIVSGLVNGRTKLEINRGPNTSKRTRLIMAFLGGILFAYGARMARGCTSGQALSGGAVLSAGSWALMMCIFAGAYGLAYFVRRLWN